MMKTMSLILFLNLACLFSLQAQKLSLDDRKAILSVLDKQILCWNKGDIDCFMGGYWKSDSLSFISNNEIMHGWQFVYDRYKKHYPDKSSMGTLVFTIHSLKALSDEYAYVVGKWEVVAKNGGSGGHFSLIFRRIKGRWLIVADHTG